MQIHDEVVNRQRGWACEITLGALIIQGLKTQKDLSPKGPMRKPSLFIALVYIVFPLSAAGQSISADAAYGDIALSAGFTPDPWAKHLTAGGSISPDHGSCSYGYVANAPDIELTWEGGGSTLYIYVMSKGGADATLLVNTPDGSWSCDDDGFGDTDPIIQIAKAPSGVYDIWVGTYSSSTFGATLFVSELDPRNALGSFFEDAEVIRR